MAVIDVRCSAGTYVRALARDLGETVGSAAYLGALVRTASGPFELGQATPLDDIRAAATESPAGLMPYLQPIDSGLEALPVVSLTAAEVDAIAKGQYIRPAGGVPGGAEYYRLQAPSGALVAIASASAGRLAPDKVFVAPSQIAPSAAS